MASLYKRSRSPFWWVKYRNPTTGKIVRESTGFRVGIGKDFGRARERRAECALKEARCSGVRTVDVWATWVPGYMAIRYANAPRTLRRLNFCWRFLASFLEENGIFGPQQLNREHCLAYMPWRRRKVPSQGFNGISHNAALLDLKLLAVLMGEAVRRGMVHANCCRDLGLKKTAAEPKAEMSDSDIAKIRAAIVDRASDSYPYLTKFDWAHFFRVSFEIAIHQGCRLSETCIDVNRDVDLENMAIRFHAKGDRYYETALNPALVPLFKELRASGHRMTFEMPKNRTMLSLAWHRLFARIGLGHLTFHSTRVTAISRLERAGAPEAVVMQLVNHASTTVHRIYRRVSSRELSKFWPSVQGGLAASDGPRDLPPGQSLPATI